ncbi:MAG TPA: transglutaminase domain-containing protein [Edaphocola sp.]|nr:transglutaminase domain-containing protein [Edaphocola sp.]
MNLSLSRIAAVSFIALLFIRPANAKNHDIVDNNDSLKFYLQKSEFAIDKGQHSGAIILSESGTSFLKDNTLTYKVQRTIKVLSPNIKTELATVSLPALGAMNARNIKGEVYSLEAGKIVKQKFGTDKSVHLEQWANQLKFDLPEIPAGTIIHYSYILEFSPVVTLPTWSFQHQWPTLESTFQNTVLSLLNCFISLQTSQAFKTVSNEDDLIHEQAGIFTVDHGEGLTRTTIWVRRDLPATPTDSNGLPEKVSLRVNMNAWSNWEVLNNLYFKYHSLYATAFDGNGFLKKTVNRLTIGKQTPLEKAQAIYDFVRDSISIDNELFSAHVALHDVLKSRKGNSRDVNILLAAMLQSAGLNADPMIFRHQGQLPIKASLPGINDYIELGLMLNVRDRVDLIQQVARSYMVPAAQLLKFSYSRSSKAVHIDLSKINETGVYLQIDNKPYFLAAGPDKSDFGTLPAHTIGYGRVIDKNGGSWVQL